MSLKTWANCRLLASFLPYRVVLIFSSNDQPGCDKRSFTICLTECFLWTKMCPFPVRFQHLSSTELKCLQISVHTICRHLNFQVVWCFQELLSQGIGAAWSDAVPEVEAGWSEYDLVLCNVRLASAGQDNAGSNHSRLQETYKTRFLSRLCKYAFLWRVRLV